MIRYGKNVFFNKQNKIHLLKVKLIWSLKYIFDSYYDNNSDCD